MKTTSSKSVLPVFIIFIALLLIAFIFGALGFAKALLSMNWPTTIGTVVSSEVIRPSGKNTKYEAEIKYLYKIDTVEYLSDNFKATSARGTSEWAKKVINQYPVNTKVTVYYNPRKPKESVIEPGLQSDNFYMTIGPLIFIILVLLALVKHIKDTKKPDIAT